MTHDTDPAAAHASEHANGTRAEGPTSALCTFPAAVFTPPGLDPMPIGPNAGPVTMKVEITPQMAAQWLNHNTSNRPLNTRMALSMSEKMRAGDWVLNGETVKFSASGVLLDGQTRLTACVHAGVSFPSLVVWNITHERAFATIDDGTPRKASDIFYIGGFSDQNMYAAAALILFHYERGEISLRGMRSSRGPIEKDALLKYAQGFAQELRSAATICRSSTANRFITRSMVLALNVIFRRIDETAAQAFFRDLGDGANMQKTDPVYWLRERLIANKAGAEKLPRESVMALCIVAWNKRRAGEPCKMLKLGENFPLAA